MRRDKNFLMLIFLWKFLFWTLSIFKRGPDIRIFPTLSNFKNVNFIYTNFSRVRLDFIYSNAGWALFHANRSLFRIIWWNWKIMYNNYKIYYQYLKNEMKRHRPTAMIELSVTQSPDCVMHTGDTTSNHHWSDFTRSLKNKIGNSENISWYTLSRWRLVA